LTELDRPLAHLTILGPGEPMRVVMLNGGVVIAGSGPACDVGLGDPDAEEMHAEFRVRDGHYVVVRRGAILWVNGKRVREHVLTTGDLVVVGRTAIAFRWGAPPTTSPREKEATFAAVTCERLLALAGRMRGNDGPAALRQQLVADVLALTGADVACCAWIDETGAPSILEVAPDPISPGELVLSRTIIARVLDTKRAVSWRDVTGVDPLECAESLKAAAVSSVLAAPVWSGGRLAAILYASSKRRTVFEEDIVDLVVLYARLTEHLLEDFAKLRELEARASSACEDLEVVRKTTIVGVSPVMRQLDAELRKVARSELPVLVVGETGTGKELVARQIHEQSARRGKPFVAVNSAAIPSELVEATLFGHVRGAFTGAHAPSSGLVQAANEGTLFLDEIAELPLDKQAKLLRVLETGEVLPLGASAPVRVDFRLVSATLRPLDEARRSGVLRDDLFFRIAGVVLRLPPLRERGEDVIALAEHFLRQQRVALSRPRLRFSAAALAALRGYAWPGNVRELASAIARAAALVEHDALEPDDFGISISRAEIAPGLVPLVDARDAFQKRYVLEAVERFGGNRTAAAEALGVSARTVYKYLDEI
jgi:DNA-binding NtrC family response regulator